jgi:hypothetical protein
VVPLVQAAVVLVLVLEPAALAPLLGVQPPRVALVLKAALTRSARAPTM